MTSTSSPPLPSPPLLTRHARHCPVWTRHRALDVADQIRRGLLAASSPRCALLLTIIAYQEILTLRFPSAISLLDGTKLALEGKPNHFTQDVELDIVGIGDLCPGRRSPAFTSRWGQEKLARIGQVSSGVWHVSLGASSRHLRPCVGGER